MQFYEVNIGKRRHDFIGGLGFGVMAIINPIWSLVSKCPFLTWNQLSNVFNLRDPRHLSTNDLPSAVGHAACYHSKPPGVS